jgi:hypothetical protein
METWPYAQKKSRQEFVQVTYPSVEPLNKERGDFAHNSISCLPFWLKVWYPYYLCSERHNYCVPMSSTALSLCNLQENAAHVSSRKDRTHDGKNGR